MKMITTEENNFFVITPDESRLDARVAIDFKSQIQTWVSDGHKRLLLDMKNVSFMDSSGLGAIVACLKSVGTEGDLQLCSINPPVMTLIKLTRLDRIFTIHSDKDTALA